MTVTPYTAKRTLALIAHCEGDLNRASYECHLTLRSLGSYTDRKTSAVMSVIDHILRATPERQAVALEKLALIAAIEETVR